MVPVLPQQDERDPRDSMCGRGIFEDRWRDTQLNVVSLSGNSFWFTKIGRERKRAKLTCPSHTPTLSHFSVKTWQKYVLSFIYLSWGSCANISSLNIRLINISVKGNANSYVKSIHLYHCYKLQSIKFF